MENQPTDRADAKHFYVSKRDIALILACINNAALDMPKHAEELKSLHIRISAQAGL